MSKLKLRTINFVLLILAGTLLSACGIMGNTTRSVVQIENQPATGQFRPISVGTVAREDEGNRLLNVRVFAWGKFSDDDQSNIEASLADTLHAATHRIGQPSGDPIKVHVLIRKYFVASSNNGGAIFAGVDWALTATNNQLMFQDAFYATRECHFPQLCTLGGLKDAVNSAIIRRIAQKAITFATGGHPESVSNVGTYSTFESAAATMPTTIKSSGAVYLSGSVPVFVPDSAPAKVEVDWAEMKPPVDWNRRLTNTQQ